MSEDMLFGTRRSAATRDAARLVGGQDFFRLGRSLAATRTLVPADPFAGLAAGLFFCADTAELLARFATFTAALRPAGLAASATRSALAPRDCTVSRMIRSTRGGLPARATSLATCST